MASVLPETRRGPERPGGRRARPPALAAARARRQVRDRHDPKRIRYGCFLPDLTGLATAPPTPAPRGGYIRSRGRSHKGNPDCESSNDPKPVGITRSFAGAVRMILCRPTGGVGAVSA